MLEGGDVDGLLRPIMQVFLTSCETHEGAWRHQESMLREFARSSSGRHFLVESPDKADVIVIGNIREENWYSAYLNSPFIAKYADKCFAISDADDPRPFLRGLYTSATKSLLSGRRVRSASYSLYHPDFQNPYVRDYRNEQEPVAKKYLYSFLGRNCHPLRKRILERGSQRADVLIDDSSSFNLFRHDNQGKGERQEKFAKILAESKFALCPRGNGASSIRLFEAMRTGVAPVILSDDWVKPQGVDWSKCAIFIPEAEVDKIEAVILKHEHLYKEIGAQAAEAYRRCFSPEAYFDYVVDNCAGILNTQRLPERYWWKTRRWILRLYKLQRRLQARRPNA